MIAYPSLMSSISHYSAELIAYPTPLSRVDFWTGDAERRALQQFLVETLLQEGRPQGRKWTSPLYPYSSVTGMAT